MERFSKEARECKPRNFETIRTCDIEIINRSISLSIPEKEKELT